MELQAHFLMAGVARLGIRRRAWIAVSIPLRRGMGPDRLRYMTNALPQESGADSSQSATLAWNVQGLRARLHRMVQYKEIGS